MCKYDVDFNMRMYCSILFIAVLYFDMIVTMVTTIGADYAVYMWHGTLLYTVKKWGSLKVVYEQVSVSRKTSCLLLKVGKMEFHTGPPDIIKRKYERHSLYFISVISNCHWSW